MPLALKSEKKKKQFLHRFWKGSTRCVAYWLWEKPETLDVGSYKRNHKEKSSSIVVLCPLQRIVYDKVEEASSIGLTVVTVTDCRVEDIESGKYQLIFASAKNALVKPFFLLMKKKPHHFTRVCRFASNRLWRVNLRVLLLVL